VLSVETELPSGLARICHRVILINADIKAIIVQGAMSVATRIYIFIAELLTEEKYAETRIVFQLRPEIKSAY